MKLNGCIMVTMCNSSPHQDVTQTWGASLVCLTLNSQDLLIPSWCLGQMV